METHIYIRSFGRKGYLTGLETIMSVMSFPTIGIALHTCYTVVSIALSLLLLGHTFPRSRALRGMLTFLGLFAMKGPFFLRLTSVDN